jgi:hypothetical protein
MNDIVAKIFEGMDQALISDETKKKVTDMINQIVEARVVAKTSDVLEKNKKLVVLAKEAQQLTKTMSEEFAQKEAILREEAQNFSKSLAQQFSEKESVFMETLKEYKQSTEATIKEVALEYREALEHVVMEEAAQYREWVEQVALEEASGFKAQHEAELAKDVSKFKETMLERVNEYLEGQISKHIPESVMESAAEAAAYKPLVEKLVKVLGDNYITLDSTGYEAIKSAKNENAKLTEAVNMKAKEQVKLESRVKELEKKVKLTSLTEGMTQAQKKKAEKFLESYGVDQLDTKFAAIKDLIITESVKPERVSIKQETKSEHVERQVQKIVESATKPVSKSGPASEMSEWASSLEKMRRA